MYYFMKEHAASGNGENMTFYSGGVRCCSILVYRVRNSRIPEATEIGQKLVTKHLENTLDMSSTEKEQSTA